MNLQSCKCLATRVVRKAFYPVVPQKNRIAFRYWLSLVDGSCEQEMRHLDRIVQERQTAVDVGANAGLFSYVMSKKFSKVYSFEINDGISKELSAYNPGNIEIINKGLSSQKGTATLYVPVLDGTPLTGWASLTPNNCPDTKEHLEKQVEICPLDAFNLRSISFIKIDVEGHELEVLKGAMETLVNNRPVVLIEVRQQNREAVFALFASLNYQQKKFQDFMDKSIVEENYIFVPKEKL